MEHAKSRRDTEDSTQHQGRCKQCGKRTNLSKKNTWSFRTPEQAYEFCTAISQGGICQCWLIKISLDNADVVPTKEKSNLTYVS